MRARARARVSVLVTTTVGWGHSLGYRVMRARACIIHLHSRKVVRDLVRLHFLIQFGIQDDVAPLDVPRLIGDLAQPKLRRFRRVQASPVLAPERGEGWRDGWREGGGYRRLARRQWHTIAPAVDTSTYQWVLPCPLVVLDDEPKLRSGLTHQHTRAALQIYDRGSGVWSVGRRVWLGGHRSINDRV